jgi:hypothetical protein
MWNLDPGSVEKLFRLDKSRKGSREKDTESDGSYCHGKKVISVISTS